ncbi:MAG: hypothetical protein DWQ04_05025 [Chloroflexi bacterium]|nr:MAG: hypothetical protein DWQ04_05025 [Chloroflexota bacterium]
MRFIVREQANEKPIAAGLLRYERDGQPTGAVEKWRLTSPMAGYEVLRVDLDARDAPSGHSFLFHLVRQQNGRFERLGARFWGDGMIVEETLIFEEQRITGTRTIKGKTYSLDAPISLFWFPSSVGLGLLAGHVGEYTAVTLNTQSNSYTETFDLQNVTLNTSLGDAKPLTIGSRGFEIRPFTIQWDNQSRTIWLDENNWPLKMERGDGLTAVETRYIRY